MDLPYVLWGDQQIFMSQQSLDHYNTCGPEAQLIFLNAYQRMRDGEDVDMAHVAAEMCEADEFHQANLEPDWTKQYPTDEDLEEHYLTATEGMFDYDLIPELGEKLEPEPPEESSRCISAEQDLMVERAELTTPIGDAIPNGMYF